MKEFTLEEVQKRIEEIEFTLYKGTRVVGVDEGNNLEASRVALETLRLLLVLEERTGLRPLDT